ncbi:type 1 glutamine amidotransferase domain-containing protein [Rhodococcus sp. A14]|uniref:type 1 glutamine amidotransferase domain-containing protein n=1 Tax=Rhodococcus sp. A14 TaxID=1194106 RepID=UPI00141EAF87|nr:type 1 glutamine amidotransferase domain-containing protein [Rhodococcus sp. A14]
MTTVLMVVTGADSLTLNEGSSHPTGFWAEEVAESHRILVDAGFEVVIATPGGVAPTADPISLNQRGGVANADAERFRDYLQTLGEELLSPIAVSAAKAEDFDAIYVPGGHGPMTDLAVDADLGSLLVDADDRGRVVAALCHGLAALLSTTSETGTFHFAGRTLTAFTNEEEAQGGVANTPYLVESRLRELGALIETADPWSSHVIVDRNLVTGQNPQSSVATAQAVVAALSN